MRLALTIHPFWRASIVGLLCLTSVPRIVSAEAAQFGESAEEYARVMIEHGRDTYGDEHSPIFATILSRTDPPSWLNEGNIPQSTKKLPGWEGRYYDRAWGGGNLAHHIQLHLLLNELTLATGNAVFRQASDDEIRFYFEKTQSPVTNFIVWGEHMSWNLRTESFYSKKLQPDVPHSDTHEFFDRMPPLLWERIYTVVPDQAFKYAMGIWDHQIRDQETGLFSRHAKYTEHGPDRYGAFPRVGGWMILAWTEAYRRSQDQAYRETMLKAITTLTTFYENNKSEVTGAMPAGVKLPDVDDPTKDFSGVYWLENNLLFSVEVEQTLAHLPAELAKRLKDLNVGMDDVALTKLDHNLDGHVESAPMGFHLRARPDLPLLPNGTMQLGDVRIGEGVTIEESYSTDWKYGYGVPMTADLAMLMLERFQATKDSRWMPLITKAAERYLESEPPAEQTAPFAMATVIDLMREMHGITSDQKYMDRALYFAGMAQNMFLGDSPLPRANSSNEHYEAVSGSDDLMLSLWNLSQSQAPKKASP